jgi:hypothetical protein
MATGLSYEKVFELIPSYRRALITGKNDGTDFWDICAVFIKKKHYHRYYSSFSLKHYPDWKNEIRGIPCLLSVKSKNRLGAEHLIYWNGFRLFDPSKKKVYNNLYELNLNNVKSIIKIKEKI